MVVAGVAMVLSSVLYELFSGEFFRGYFSWSRSKPKRYRPDLPDSEGLKRAMTRLTGWVGLVLLGLELIVYAVESLD